MVILGHIIRNCIPGGSDSFLCMTLYAVHIPLFLVISGMLVKDKNICRVFFINIFKRFILPYCFWEMVLTFFFFGFTRLRNEGFTALGMSYLENLRDGLWFIRAYLLTYLLWQSLKFLSVWQRLLAGSTILVGLNLITMNMGKITEVFSLSLYTFTIFGFAASLKQHINIHSKIILSIIAILFFISILLMKPEYDYFQTSFSLMTRQHTWFVFPLRMVAGLSFSFIVINFANKLIRGWQFLFLQNIGQRTLQLYMLQALLVECLLPRYLHLPSNCVGYLFAVVLTLLMTIVSNYIIQWTSNIPLCRTLLWGLK